MALVSARRSLLAIAALSVFAALPATAAAPPFNEFPLPVANSQPRGITSGPDGALWFTEFNDQVITAGHPNSIGRINPTTGAITEFPVTRGTGPRGIALGSDNALWFTEFKGDPLNNKQGRIGRMTTAGALTNEFPLPGGVPKGGQQPRGIAAGPDGALWFTEFNNNMIGRITTGGAITEFPVPTNASTPRAITAGPDGALWFTEDAGNKIGRITTAAPNTITEFTVPTNASSPRGIAAGPDGALWFAEGLGGKIGRLDPAQAKPGTSNGITELPVPTQVPAPGTGPDGITAGPDNALWFTELTAAKLGRIDTITHAISEFPTPTAASAPDSITQGPDKAVWFTESKGNQIGCFATGATPAGACVAAVPAPAPGTAPGTAPGGTGTTPGTTGGTGGTGGGTVTPLSGKALAKKLAACAQLKGTAKARCLAQAHYGAALARCETRKGKKGKASCRKKALIAYKRELAAINCQSITSKSKRAACLRKARRIH